MPDTAAYVSSLIGRPYDMRRANCWHLTSQVMRDLFDVEMPKFGVSSARSQSARAAAMERFDGWDEWEEISAPANGAVVLLSRVGCAPDMHAGVWISLGTESGCLHTDHPHGVVIDDLLRLKLRGFDRLRFLTYK